MTSLNSETDLLSIGELSKLSGITSLCIRAWESRHGIPKAIRLPSGHRRYSREELLRLQLIGQAIEQGHRIGKLSKMPMNELQDLVETKPSDMQNLSKSDCHFCKRHFQSITDAIERGDSNFLIKDLESQVKERGLIAFLDDYMAPMLRDVGQLWHDEHLSVGHEHFFSQLCLYFLQHHWRNQAVPDNAPAWVLAGLPGDHHELALHMAACGLSLSHKKVLFLGLRTPIEDTMAWAEKHKVEGVCLSVSSNHCPQLAEQQLLGLQAWCQEHEVQFVCGGSGVPAKMSPQPESFKELVEALSKAELEVV